MKEYRRAFPAFSLCGLNCGLCPRYRTAGPSRCPGCGGPGFHLLHPSCGIVSCALRHGGPESCRECPEFPCGRFEPPSEVDSFISYRNVRRDLERSHEDPAGFREALLEKMSILDVLLEECDDGRSKGFFCLGVDLLGLEDLREVAARLASAPVGERPALARSLLLSKGEAAGVPLALRKKGKEGKERKEGKEGKEEI